MNKKKLEMNLKKLEESKNDLDFIGRMVDGQKEQLERAEKWFMLYFLCAVINMAVNKYVTGFIFLMFGILYLVIISIKFYLEDRAIRKRFQNIDRELASITLKKGCKL